MSDSEQAIVELLTRISKQLEQISPNEAFREDERLTSQYDLSPPTSTRDWS